MRSSSADEYAALCQGLSGALTVFYGGPPDPLARHSDLYDLGRGEGERGITEGTFHHKRLLLRTPTLALQTCYGAVVCSM